MRTELPEPFRDITAAVSNLMDKGFSLREIRKIMSLGTQVAFDFEMDRRREELRKAGERFIANTAREG